MEEGFTQDAIAAEAGSAGDLYAPARAGVRARPAGVLVKQPRWAAGPAVARFPETRLKRTVKSVSSPPVGRFQTRIGYRRCSEGASVAT